MNDEPYYLLLNCYIVGLAVADDLRFIQRKGAVHNLVAGVAFPNGQAVLIHGSHDTHMAGVGAAGGVGSAEVDIVTKSGHVRFFSSSELNIQIAHSTVVADEESFVFGGLEVEAASVGIVDKPDHTDNLSNSSVPLEYFMSGTREDGIFREIQPRKYLDQKQFECLQLAMPM